MNDIRKELETAFGQVCHTISEYDKLVRNGGASGSWSQFLESATDDPSGVCYELIELHAELFPDYDGEEDSDYAVSNLCFSLGQRWLAFITDGQV